MGVEVATLATLEAEVVAFRQAFADLSARVREEIVGNARAVRGVLVALFADGHVLLEGVPGLGKTLLVQSVAQAIGADFQRIQCTPDLMPADVLGAQLVREEGGERVFTFTPGPVFAELLLVDEVNRATPRTQSAFLEAMQERAVTVAGSRRALPRAFLLLATQNPLELTGTYPLPEAQLDRFMFKLVLPTPELAELQQIMVRTTGPRPVTRAPLIGESEVLRFRELIRQVPLAPAAERLAAELVHGSQPDTPVAPPRVRRLVLRGASPRAAQAMIRAARVEALLDGRFVVGPEDVLAWALPALRHRLILRVEADLEGIDADEVVQELVRYSQAS